MKLLKTINNILFSGSLLLYSTSKQKLNAELISDNSYNFHPSQWPKSSAVV